MAKAEQTRIYNGRSGWVGQSYISEVGGYDWSIYTYASKGEIVTTISRGKMEQKGSFISFQYADSMFSQQGIRTTEPGRGTEAKIKEVHYKVLVAFDTIVDANGGPPREPELKIGDQLYFRGYGDRDHLYIYEINKGQGFGGRHRYRYVDADKLVLGEAENVTFGRDSKGIGYYHWPELKPMNPDAVFELVMDATIKKRKDEEARESEILLSRSLEDAKAEAGADKVNIPKTAKAMIVADMWEDHSDSMTDYFSASADKKQRVYLAFSSTDRNNLNECSQAAALFGPTAAFTGSEYQHRNSGGYYLPSYYVAETTSWHGWKVHKVQLEDARTYAIAAEEGRWLVKNGTAKQASSDISGDYVLTVVKGKHTKYGTDIFTVTISGRVPETTFGNLRNKAKELGGYYSSFRGNGAVPGFIFKTQQGAEQFAEVKADKDASAKREKQEDNSPRLRIAQAKAKAAAARIRILKLKDQ